MSTTQLKDAYDPTPTIASQGGGGDTSNVRATPESFGAGVGAAAEKAGNTGFDVAQHFQSIYNDSLARDTYVSASQKLGDIENQYRQNKGLNAATAYPVFQKQTNELYEQTAASLPNMEAQKQFKDQFSREVAYSQKSAGEWAADQAERGHLNSLDAGVANSVNQFAVATNDPQRRESLAGDIRDQTIQIAHARGDFPEVADMMVSKNVGAGYSALIRQTAKSNPELAQQLLEEATTKSFTVNRTGPDGTTKEVKVPYVDAEQSGAITSEMNSEYRRQAHEAIQESNMFVTNGKPYDKVALSYALKTGGYNDEFIRAETTRLDSVLGSSAQKNTDMHLSINGGQVLNNAPMAATAPLSVRDNNPGNLKDNATGEFRKFATPAEGLTAMQDDLSAKISGNSPAMKAKLGDKYSPTLSNLISVYAPEKDNNDTKSYVNSVSKQTGIAPDQVLTAEDITKIMPAMIKVEGGNSASNHFDAVNRSNPNDLMRGAQGDPNSMFQIARNLTSVTPLSDDAVTLSKMPEGPAKDMMLSAAQVKSSLLAPTGDPAGYVMSHNDLLSAAQQEAFKDPNKVMPNGPVDAPNITNMGYYVKTMDNIYDSMHQPLTNRPILSTDVGNKMVADLVASGTQGGIEKLENMKASYGENYGRVYSDLVRYGLPAQFQVAQGIDNPLMRQRLARAYSAPEQNAKETSAVEKTFDLAMGGKGGKGVDSAKTTVDQTVDGPNSAWKTYTASLSASGATPKDIASYTSVVKRLAYQGVLDGEAPDKAAANAMDALAGQFTYGLDKARIPKNIAPIIERNATAFKDNLTEDQIHTPSYAESPELYAHSVRHNGEYITNSSGNGLWLKDQNGYLVEDKSGQPVVIPFTLAQQKAQQDRSAKTPTSLGEAFDYATGGL